MKFKQNDIVICTVSNRAYLTCNKEYAVLKYNDGYKACPIIQITDDFGAKRYIAASEFILKVHGKKINENKILEENALDKQYVESQG